MRVRRIGRSRRRTDGRRGFGLLWRLTRARHCERRRFSGGLRRPGGLARGRQHEGRSRGGMLRRVGSRFLRFAARASVRGILPGLGRRHVRQLYVERFGGTRSRLASAEQPLGVRKKERPRSRSEQRRADESGCVGAVVRTGRIRVPIHDGQRQGSAGRRPFSLRAWLERRCRAWRRRRPPRSGCPPVRAGVSRARRFPPARRVAG